jgi:hypothetical protein
MCRLRVSSAFEHSPSSLFGPAVIQTLVPPQYLIASQQSSAIIISISNGGTIMWTFFLKDYFLDQCLGLFVG